jgi:limonene-1,2-epoxide hydrolase
MHANQTLVERFYAAFAVRDHVAMSASYHVDAHFSDPVFTDLHGWRIGAMWQMLCERGTDLEIIFGGADVDGEHVNARWDARYTFSATGRRVYNRISARFAFKDGRIVDHRDQFDLTAWTRMALGPVGLLLGWTPMVQNKVRRQAAANLESFIIKRALDPSLRRATST